MGGRRGEARRGAARGVEDLRKFHCLLFAFVVHTIRHLGVLQPFGQLKHETFFEERKRLTVLFETDAFDPVRRRVPLLHTVVKEVKERLDLRPRLSLVVPFGELAVVLATVLEKRESAEEKVRRTTAGYDRFRSERGGNPRKRGHRAHTRVARTCSCAARSTSIFNV